MTRTKSIVLALAGLLVILAALAGVKFAQITTLMNSGDIFAPPPAAVSSFKVEQQAWPNVFRATATVEADEGIVVAAEVQGKVQRIAFKSGQQVKTGEVLVEQESSNERAQLDAASARLKLAQASYQRLLQLQQQKLVSQSDVDNGRQQLDSAQGDVDNLRATLQKKVVRAPFDGRLSLRQVDLGQDLLVGTPIVSLQATHRVRVNIPVPQAWLLQMKKGLPVHIYLDDVNKSVLRSEVMALSADIDTKTRSAMVQTSLNNREQRLVPGMAVAAEIELSEPATPLVVPSTAIIYASYGDTVFVIESDNAGKKTVRQQFVQLGKARGDFVEVLKGLNVGDEVVSAGGFKLFTGMAVVINNDSTQQPYSTTPSPSDS